jgi:hypothetical protein
MLDLMVSMEVAEAAIDGDWLYSVHMLGFLALN